MPATSIIICSSNDAKYRACEQMYARLLPAESFEMIRIPDATSLAAGYNRGISRAAGENLLFVHDDVEILSPNFADRFSEHLREFDLIGLAGTSLLLHPMWLAAGPPFVHGQVAHAVKEGGFGVDLYGAGSRIFDNIQALDGLFIGVRKTVARQIGFDEETFDGFHLYDLDFTYRAYHAGFKQAVVCDIHVLHHSGGIYDAIWNIYANRFVAKHHSKFERGQVKEYRLAWVQAPDRDAIRQAMTPRTWGRP